MNCSAILIEQRQMKIRSHGFTLIEVLVVLAILSILAMLALPSSDGKINRVRIQETLKLVDPYKAPIEGYYRLTEEFPEDNEAAGLPLPEQIIGNFLIETKLADGAIHLRLGNKIGTALQGKVISLRPIFVPGVEAAPISWICGYDTVPDGMVVAGENLTDIERTYLPLSCF